MKASASILAVLVTASLPISTALAAPLSATDCQLTQPDPVCVCENVKGKHGKTFPCDDAKLGPKCIEKGGTVRKLLEGDNPSNPITVTCTGSESADSDADGVADYMDNCPSVANPTQTDSDGDGTGDACDICPFAFDNGVNDSDDDGIGNACDNCPVDHNPTQSDVDGDGIGDICDNCPFASNPSQQDTDADGIGDVCDPS